MKYSELPGIQTYLTAMEALVFAMYWKMTGNPWQNFQRRYVLTVVWMISENKFGRTSSAWETSGRTKYNKVEW